MAWGFFFILEELGIFKKKIYLHQEKFVERDSSQIRSGSETSGSSASGPIHKSGATRFSMGEKRDVLSPTTSKSGFSGFSDVGATRHMIHPAVAPGFLPAAAATSRASAASPSSSGDVGSYPPPCFRVVGSCLEILTFIHVVQPPSFQLEPVSKNRS